MTIETIHTKLKQAPLAVQTFTNTGVNSLGFAKSEAQTRVVVAMSGGVDSSVCAALLADQGYEVIGITLQLYDHGVAIKKAKACCSGQDIYDAKRVAQNMGFAHYVLDYESKFKDAVIDDFADTYLKGATPIPCVRCNQTVKFQDLLGVARELGADCMVTGHYVRRIEGADGVELHAGVEQSKDQSYFLFATTREQLDFLRFPLGGCDKAQTRALAVELGLDIASKPDSQDICFVPTGKYTDVIEKIRPDAAKVGDILHVDGTVMGQHKGIMHYTIGQRRGIGLAEGSGQDPLYVLRLDADHNHVIVGPRKKLAKSKIFIEGINWLGADNAVLANQKVLVKTRSTAPKMAATIISSEETGDIEIHLDTPIEGISPGQACVLYDPNNPSRVLGGGWIDRAV